MENRQDTQGISSEDEIKERKRLERKQYRATHHEQIIASKAIWQKRNKDKCNGYMRKWREKHRDEWNAYQREWARKKRLKQAYEKLKQEGIIQ